MPNYIKYIDNSILTCGILKFQPITFQLLLTHAKGLINPFIPGNANESKIDKFSKIIITNWIEFKTKQHDSKVLLSSFPMNGHALGFCTCNQKLGKFVSPKV